MTSYIRVSGGTQDGVYKAGGESNGRTAFILAGFAFDGPGIYWANYGVGDLFRWQISDSDGNAIYYSLSNVATPDKATNWLNFADDSPAGITVSAFPLNQWEKNFVSLYGVMTRNLSLEIKVTIPGFCIDAPAILSEVSRDDIFTEGPLAENGGWEVIMLLRDLSALPPKKTVITANGDASGRTLQIMGDIKKTNSATATFTAGDFTAKNR